MYNLPPQVIVNKVVPKTKFVEQLGATSRMKEHFVRDVERFVWLGKLVPSTLNVLDGKDVHEVAIFQIQLKAKGCPNDIFTFIDNFLPRHTLFVLCMGGQVCQHINYKVASQGVSDKKYNVVSIYRGDWQAADELRIALSGQNMDEIYAALVRQVAGKTIKKEDVPLSEAVQASLQDEKRQREIAALEKRIAVERQPTKKFALHQQLLQIKKLATTVNRNK